MLWSNPRIVAIFVETIMMSMNYRDFRNNFYVFAVRITRSSKVTRNLSPGYYHLYDGFRIENDCIYVSQERLGASVYDWYMGKSHPRVNISAIVGPNGSGKSTIVEFIMRLINNLSAHLFGEYKTDLSSEHLHYVDGVNGELFILKERYIYRLIARSSNIHIDTFRCLNYYNSGEFEYEYRLIERSSGTHLDRYKERPLISLSNESIISTLSKWFYTIVSNSSIYAYNTADFYAECNSSEYEREIRHQNQKIFSIEERCWLNGIFSKHDGYQIPLCITPYRHKGNIDINNEQELAKENLLRNILSVQNGMLINDHLKVSQLNVSVKHKYDLLFIHRNLGYTQFTSDDIRVMKTIITGIWSQQLNTPLVNRPGLYNTYAKSYLVYKTLKIASNYSEYRWFYDRYQVKQEPFNPLDFKQLVIFQTKNLSHVTRKLYRTIGYLTHGIYNQDSTIDIDDICRQWHEIGKALPSDSLVERQTYYESLLPPPFLKCSLTLSDLITGDLVDFETMSSGEKQMVYSTSSILCHLNNLDSVSDDMSTTDKISYDYVNLILEEVELYYHPSMQKRFIKSLLDGIKGLNLKSIKGINICVVTHSPFVLSDINSHNILALKDGESTRGVKAFGANVHELLKDAFFMNDGTIGDIAYWTIRKISASLMEYREGKSCSITQTDLLHMIQGFDEPIIKKVLLDDYNRTFPEDNEYLILRREELTNQLREIEAKLNK